MASAAAPPAALAGPPAAARADAPSAAAAAAAATVPSAFANNDAFERFKARWRHWTEEYGLAPDPTSAYPRHGGGGGGGTGGGHEALLASGFLPATDVRVVGSSQPMDLVAYAPADYQSSRREITRRKHVHQMADTAVKHRLAAAHHALVPVPTAAAAAMPGAARPLAGRVVRRDAATAAPLSPRSGSAALGSRAAAPGHATPRPRPRDAVVQTAQAVSQALFAAAEALPLPACSPTRADAAARGARGASRIAFADAVDVMPSASFAASDAAAAGATTGAPAVRPKSALKSAGGAAARAGSASTAPTRSPSSAAVPHVHGHAHGPDGGDGDGDGAPAAPSTPVEPALAPSRPLSSHRGGHGPGSLPGASSAASASASASRGGHFDGTGASQALDGALADGVYSVRHSREAQDPARLPLEPFLLHAPRPRSRPFPGADDPPSTSASAPPPAEPRTAEQTVHWLSPRAPTRTLRARHADAAAGRYDTTPFPDLSPSSLAMHHRTMHPRTTVPSFREAAAAAADARLRGPLALSCVPEAWDLLQAGPPPRAEGGPASAASRYGSAAAPATAPLSGVAGCMAVDAALGYHAPPSGAAYLRSYAHHRHAVAPTTLPPRSSCGTPGPRERDRVCYPGGMASSSAGWPSRLAHFRHDVALAAAEASARTVAAAAARASESP
ncbi:hypothetical protein CXG81DRAFT_27227 [Caulochytrium protostelioides]|uniref:Uncharacterized protein n=1 Tax=Caulochytrium protostelioides TaxID=1555241 RepID=A0A4P9X4M6_9FUNG|nr:hypothetical protein CXG81DRAFT_27227 [Caulochytrium protostelioides]|eukprot:RKP00037.1 hypothetical protein CXG81DRAFT_27227 [Caulochytrium protostelioides]